MKSSGGGGPSDHGIDRRLPFFDVSERLFVLQGFERTTVEEICRTLGASKRTFYGLFRNKLDLLIQLSLHVAEEIVTRWREKTSGVSSATTLLELFIKEYENVGREREILRIIMSVPGVFSLDMDLAIFKDSPLTEAMTGILQRGMTTGEFKISNPEYMTWVVFAFLDSTYYLVPLLGHQAGPLDSEELAGEVRSVLIHGLLTRTQNGDSHEQ